MYLTMYDSIRAAGMPPDGDVYACYTDGIYANEAAVRAAFPGKPIVRISAVGRADADFVDIEPGCVWPPSAASAWLAARPEAGIYCGLANLASVVAVHGPARRYWVAHYTNAAHICSQGRCGFSTAGANIVGVQYGGDSNAGGYHFDVSGMLDAAGLSSAVEAAEPITATATAEDHGMPGKKDYAISDEQGNVYALGVNGWTYVTPEQHALYLALDAYDADSPQSLNDRARDLLFVRDGGPAAQGVAPDHAAVDYDALAASIVKQVQPMIASIPNLPAGASPDDIASAVADKLASRLAGK